MGSTTKQPSTTKQHLKHHEYPNEYEFETVYTHQSDDKTMCQTLTLNSVWHSKDVIADGKLKALGITWLLDQPKAIDVGSSQFWRVIDYPIYIRYTYINKDGNRVSGETKVPMPKQ